MSKNDTIYQVEWEFSTGHTLEELLIELLLEKAREIDVSPPTE